ncbi:MAG: hypothetical protein PVI86_15600 [Phycisphaerae bacterium]
MARFGILMLDAVGAYLTRWPGAHGMKANRMRARSATGSTTALVAYAVAMFVPVFHAYLHGHDVVRADCDSEHAPPALTSGCGPDCTDPTHHHQHVRYPCVLCKTPHEWQTAPTLSHDAVDMTLAGPTAPQTARQIPGSPTPGPVPIRGPPSAIYS